MMSIPLSPPLPPTLQTKDLTFLLHPTNFHPLPLTLLPAPFLSAPAPTGTPAELLKSLHFRAAAIAAAACLTASRQPDNATILELWYIRLLSLCLAQYHNLAAQEIKVFQDLGSSFYLDPVTGRSVLPWELRVLAVNLGTDPRRAIGVYYELAAECRAAAVDGAITVEERSLWRARLGELGIRVANTLIQLGDLAVAARHLRGLKKQGKGQEMLTLLYIRAGMIDAARECAGPDDNTVRGLLLMADGNWKDAAQVWREMESEMAINNLAVCELYLGRLNEARQTLERLVEKGVVFEGMIFNLATVYELCGETSRALKLQLAEKVAGVGREFLNQSFKM
ncbi:hypothetical protein K440DRAFT_88991 [Wilcoxina mikolae CBS 423.85]|nr:hypothetical protein K440DRAFT_88991 [Wilcoxina mikolae CBS 423.85]